MWLPGMKPNKESVADTMRRIAIGIAALAFAALIATIHPVLATSPPGKRVALAVGNGNGHNLDLRASLPHQQRLRLPRSILPPP
jgi:hypothetical protein